MHPSLLSINDFSYHLPEGRIAKIPLEERDQSRLLVFSNKEILDGSYRDLATYLPAGSLLVFNNTKVIEARVLFQKATGGVIELFILEPADRYKDVSEAMQQRGEVHWKCLIGGASKWKHGQVLKKEMQYNGDMLVLTASIAERLEGSFLVTFSWQPATLSFIEVLHNAGLIPIPPYLKRETTESDKERYQTIFAKAEGSVAAPTAALHFTEPLFASLGKKNISSEFVTLHVGAGTFMPVKSQQMKDHEMHAEFLEVEKSSINKLIDNLGKIFPVGTTSLRTIESLYWMGLKCLKDPAIPFEQLAIQQWEIYDCPVEDQSDSKTVLTALLKWMANAKLEKLVIRTKILIAPGYSFKLTSGLLTNFHQPQSTLLLLVAALIGDDWKKIYEHATNNGYRFLSYGDGCLLYTV